ncbi:MAG: flagellar basal body L-ring protein FlgH [Armatimonadota bacterium]|nr:flagellar basal body L-ring protein FlgH [Armatimonadota bacterium]
MVRIGFVVSVVAIMVSVGVASNGESLWQTGSQASLYADRKASKVGDTLTVLIVESASSSSSASTDAKKSTQTEVGPGTGPIIKNIPALGYEGSDQIKASGATSRTSKFVAKMTVIVKRVTENGNLEIEGTRVVQTNRDKEEIKLTGVVRPQDISPDNCVYSTAIANAQITHTGSGPVSSRQKEGIVTKLLRILF